MGFLLHPRATLDRLRSTYWFLPSVLTVVAVGLAILLTAIDRVTPDATVWMGWGYGGGADGARALLSAVAGSMITVVSVTFSVMVVALTVSSQHFGPRLLRSFMRDQPAQLVLGTFTGTFAYCLIVLRTVQGEGGDRYSFFVPHLSVAGAVLLALASVGLLIYYVHHIAVSMQVAEITRRIAQELEETIERLYPEPIGSPADAPVHTPPLPAGAVSVEAAESGYVQSIDAGALLQVATERQVQVWITAIPGDFVIAGGRVAAFHPPHDGEGSRAALRGAFRIGVERTPGQDAAFGVQQLVEVALRALSPSTNEPFTAVTAIDRLAQALTSLAVRRIPSPVRTDDAGQARIVTQPRTFERLVTEAFAPIAAHTRGDMLVIAHLFRTWTRLASVVRRPEDRAAIVRLADRLYAAASRDVVDEHDRLTLAGLHADLGQASERL